MFGGYGLYHRDVMFALVSDDILYLKADDALARVFEARGLVPFQYQKGDKVIAMSYYEAPPELFDAPEEAATWARRAYRAAVAVKEQR
jgi:DNA transformation protein